MKPINQVNIVEGFNRGDLKNCVSDTFTIDQYKSKMGEDSDVVVLGFRLKEKYPAVDFMEFIERGYSFILDADVSAGEESDGQYQVFVEMQRTAAVPSQIQTILTGIGHLCNCYEWRFRYQKASTSMVFTEEAIKAHVPLNVSAYEQAMLVAKNKDISEFFNQGTTEVFLEFDNTLTFKKPFAGDISAKFIAIGEYESVKNLLPGPLSLDESSQTKMLFLNKYLGNYDINKIGESYLIRNGDQAVIIIKDRW